LVGIESLQELSQLAGEYLASLFNTPLLYVGHQQPKEHLTNLCFINESALSPAEIIFGLLRTLDKLPFNKLVANALLASLLEGSGGLRPKEGKVSPNLLKVMAELLDLGADPKEASLLAEFNQPKSTIQIEKDNNFSQLSEYVKTKALESLVPTEPILLKAPLTPTVRILDSLVETSQEDPRLNFRWLTLNLEQTRQFQLGEGDFENLTLRLTTKSPPMRGAFVLAENSSNNPHRLFRCWLTYPSEKILKQLTSLVGGQQKDLLLIFTVRGGDLNEAQGKILKLARALSEI